MFGVEVGRMIGGSKVLSLEAETEALLAGDRDTLIGANYKLVASLVRNYHTDTMSSDDFFMYGVIGLSEAVDSFDVSKVGEIRFATYAQWIIRKHIGQAFLGLSNVVSVPNNVQDEVKMAKKAGEEVESFTCVSMDSPVGEDALSMHEVLCVENSLIEDITGRELIAIIRQIKLSEVERKVIDKAYGLDGGAGLTNEEIGEIIGLTRERTRQIRKVAEKKVRKEFVMKEIAEGKKSLVR
jgi:RNA polymerase sigma factor (sigma-70 family)